MDDINLTNEIPIDDRFLAHLPMEDIPISGPDDLPFADLAGIDDTHPATDSNMQLEEVYDEGLAGAAEISAPIIGSPVIGYDPTKDQRRKNNS